MNKKHGSPYDRGSADSYYDRIYAPHSLYNGEPDYDLTDQEIEEYRQGYMDNEIFFGDKKDYE